jgi:hypothetical protein
VTPNITRFFVVFGSFILFVQGQIIAQAVPSGEHLMPENTRGFISITNVQTLIDHYNKTQLGKLTADPMMEPFTKDVRRQFENRWSSVHVRLGLTLDDLKEVPGGEVCVALIEPPNSSALAIVVDVTGHHPQANTLLERVTTNISQQGGKGTTLKVEECPDELIQFELPLPEEEQEADRSKLSGPHGGTSASTSAAPQKSSSRMAYYILTGNMLAATDNLEVMRGILGHLAGKKEGTLADVAGFQKVTERCHSDIGDITPQIRWFIQPLGYAAAVRAATPQQQRRKGKSILEVMRNQGLGAIQGIGGYASFSSEGFDLVHRTAVYAPLPYEKAMKMIVFLNGNDYTPQKWVPRDIATYSTLYFDIVNAFDHFGPLFDELFGEGESGTWLDVLQQLKEDPNGPQLDLREELIKYLGQRVSMVTDYELPITTSSERLLFAIESSDDQAVSAAIEKWMGNDPTAKRREIEGHVIWEIVENEGPEMDGPEVSLGDVPDLAPPPPKPKKTNQQRLMPHAAVTVLHGNLFIASHLDFLLKVLHSDDPLTRDVDYQLVNETINQLKPQDKCARVFSRTDEEYRPTYELVRQNKMPESETLLGQLLNMLFGEGKKGVVRHQKIDGSQLPEYEVVRHYLGPAGMQVTAEKDGWFLKGFTLNKEAPLGAQTAQASTLQSSMNPRETTTPAETAAPQDSAAAPAETTATPETAIPKTATPETATPSDTETKPKTAAAQEPPTAPDPPKLRESKVLEEPQIQAELPSKQVEKQ